MVTQAIFTLTSVESTEEISVETDNGFRVSKKILESLLGVNYTAVSC